MEMEREGNRKIKIKEKEENCRKGCLDERKREKSEGKNGVAAMKSPKP